MWWQLGTQGSGLPFPAGREWFSQSPSWAAIVLTWVACLSQNQSLGL